MEHLLDISNFLVEALTPYYKKKYKTFFKGRPTEVQERLNKLLDNGERVYIPYDSDTISETQLKVKSYLEENGYVIHDYKQNLAYQTENPKRVLRISKLLAKNPELMKEFTLDDTRANTRVGSDFSIVLTSNYEDVAGMSFERCWDNSCLDIRDGGNKHYVKDEVQYGTVVAYLIKSDDLEIEKPLGRVNIKPYYSLRDNKEVLYFTDLRVYGNVPNEKLFIDKINQYLKEKQEVRTIGFYSKVRGLYSDKGSPSIVSIGKDSKVCYDCTYDEEGYNRDGFDEEGYNRDGFDEEGLHRDGGYPHQEYLTREQYRFLKDVVSGEFTINQEGKIDVDGSVYCRYSKNKKITKLPVSFGEVTGVFDCGSLKLITLEGCPFFVGGSFRCDHNDLTSLKGAPIDVWVNFDCSDNKLISLEGGPTKSSGSFSCNNNDLTSLNGLPQKIRRSFDCSGNNLNSLEGFPVEVGGNVFCSRQLNHQFTKNEIMTHCSVSGWIYCD